MKPKLFALILATIGALVGVVLIMGTATAAIPSPTTPYPNVPINNTVCLAQAIQVQQAQNTYDNALANYNRTLQLYRRNAASAYELRTDQAKVDAAGIALNDAKYAQAKCQNTAAAPANQNCVNLTLELNRLIDDLAYTQDLQGIATANYRMAQALYNQRAMSLQEYQGFQTAYNNAVLQTQLVQQQIADQRKLTTAANCPNVDRPAPVCNTPKANQLAYQGDAVIPTGTATPTTDTVVPTTDTVIPTTDTTTPTDTTTTTQTWTDPSTDTWTDTTTPDTCTTSTPTP
ncbi:MAG TPA: hypothetical protein VH352_16400 [Pseudonocardiaceae bacterium]|nr:hypothetical protein [Pseudonocardiaceae bacterium]